MAKLVFGNYVIYFTSECFKEPFHVHVNQPKPIRKDAAKIWINPYKGTYKIAELGKFKEETLDYIWKNFIKTNLSYYIEKWKVVKEITVYIDLCEK